MPKTYSIRIVQNEETKTMILTAEISETVAKEISYKCDGEWTTFKGKRAFKIADDLVFGNGSIKVYLWKGSLVVENT